MATERCITCYLPVNGGKACTCGCGRLVCSSCGAPTPASEPTATQIYNAVKALRAANGHRVLTIPEINSVLVARAEYAAGVAAGPQATPDEVPASIVARINDGWHWDLPEGSRHGRPGYWRRIHKEPGEWLVVDLGRPTIADIPAEPMTEPEQTAIYGRVVAAPTSQEDDHG